MVKINLEVRDIREVCRSAELCIEIANYKCPYEYGYKVVWIFNYWSCHRAYADDGLLANRMNPNQMENGLCCKTVWRGKVQ